MTLRFLMRSWALLLVVSLLLVASDSRPAENTYDLVAPIRGDQSVERTRVEPEFEQIATLSSGDDYMLYNPSTVRMGDDGVLYVLDSGDYTVKSFTQGGDYLATFKGGRGRGPSQFLSFTDVGVWNDSLVYVADPRQRRVSFFEKDGDFVRVEDYHEISPYRLAWTDDATKYVLPPTPLPTVPFMRIVAQDRPLDIVRLPSRSAERILQIGDLCTSDGKVIFVPKYLPVLLAYAPEDTTGVAYPTPDYGRDLPTPREGGRAPAEYFNGRPTLSGGVLSVQKPTQAEGVAFDLYNVGGMEYMRTVELPVEDARAWYAYGQNLAATIHDATVNLYRISHSGK